MYKSALKIHTQKLVIHSLTLDGRLEGQSWRTQSSNHFMGASPNLLALSHYMTCEVIASLFQLLKQMGIQYQVKMNRNLIPIAKRFNTASLQGLNIRFPSDFLASMPIHFQLAFIFKPYYEDNPQNDISK